MGAPGLSINNATLRPERLGRGASPSGPAEALGTSRKNPILRKDKMA